MEMQNDYHAQGDGGQGNYHRKTIVFPQKKSCRTVGACQAQKRGEGHSRQNNQYQKRGVDPVFRELPVCMT